MLKQITIDTKTDGTPITIPAGINEANFEQQVKRFFDLVERHDYQAAYQMWVRNDVDRRGYPFSSFLQDWGPQSDHPDVSRFHITRSRSCGSGVILTVDFDGSKQEKLWVERNDLTIGFSPLPGCPAPR